MTDHSPRIGRFPEVPPGTEETESYDSGQDQEFYDQFGTDTYFEKGPQATQEEYEQLGREDTNLKAEKEFGVETDLESTDGEEPNEVLTDGGGERQKMKDVNHDPKNSGSGAQDAMRRGYNEF